MDSIVPGVDLPGVLGESIGVLGVVLVILVVADLPEHDLAVRVENAGHERHRGRPIVRVPDRVADNRLADLVEVLRLSQDVLLQGLSVGIIVIRRARKLTGRTVAEADSHLVQPHAWIPVGRVNAQVEIGAPGDQGQEVPIGASGLSAIPILPNDGTPVRRSVDHRSANRGGIDRQGNQDGDEPRDQAGG